MITFCCSGTEERYDNITNALLAFQMEIQMNTFIRNVQIKFRSLISERQGDIKFM